MPFIFPSEYRPKSILLPAWDFLQPKFWVNPISCPRDWDVVCQWWQGSLNRGRCSPAFLISSSLSSISLSLILNNMLPSDTPPVISTLKSNNVSKHLNKSKSESKLDRTLSSRSCPRCYFYFFFNFFTITSTGKKKVCIFMTPLRHLLCAATSELSYEFSMALLECFGIAA